MAIYKINISQLTDQYKHHVGFLRQAHIKKPLSDEMNALKKFEETLKPGPLTIEDTVGLLALLESQRKQLKLKDPNSETVKAYSSLLTQILVEIEKGSTDQFEMPAIQNIIRNYIKLKHADNLDAKKGGAEIYFMDIPVRIQEHSWLYGEIRQFNLQTLQEEKAGREEKESQIRVVTLPYIHPKINLSYFKENLKLYSDSDIQKIRDLHLHDGRIKKQTLQEIQSAEWDVIKFNNQYYAVYKGKIEGNLGGGKYGNVKLAQNLMTGEFVALKIIIKGTREQVFPEMLTDETKALQSAEQLVSSYHRQVPSKQKDQFEILMKLAPGVKLTGLWEKDMPAIRWIDLCIAVIRSLDELHKRHMLHGDLHLDNMMFHIASQTIMHVDLGNVQFVTPTSDLSRAEMPNIAQSLSRLLGLMELQPGKGYVMYSPDEVASSRKIKSSETRAALIEMFSETLSAQYVSKQVAINWLNNIRGKLAQSERTICVGYLNLQDYIKADETTRGAMLSTLKEKDEVFLLDTEQTPLKKYLEIQQELEKAGLVVMPDIIQSEIHPMAAVIEHIENRKQNNSEDYIFNYSYVAKGAEQGSSVTKNGLVMDEKASDTQENLIAPSNTFTSQR